ncbi:MAG: hypothetical protein AB7V15_08280 [Acidimicrobiia bacterium]
MDGDREVDLTETAVYLDLTERPKPQGPMLSAYVTADGSLIEPEVGPEYFLG